MLLNICQRFGEELTGGPAASIPHADLSTAEWKQAEGCPLVRGQGEREMAMFKLFSQREDTYVT